MFLRECLSRTALIISCEAQGEGTALLADPFKGNAVQREMKVGQEKKKTKVKKEPPQPPPMHTGSWWCQDFHPKVSPHAVRVAAILNPLRRTAPPDVHRDLAPNLKPQDPRHVRVAPTTAFLQSRGSIYRVCHHLLV